MASLLARLGHFSARRAWLVVSAWVLLLLAMVGAVVGFGGSLSSNLTLNGTPSQAVIDQLKESFPDASRGSGQVVFHKSDGSPFTGAQKAAIDAALVKVSDLPSISGVLNPFSAQAMKDEKVAEIIDGEQKIADAPAQLDAAQAEINTGRDKLAQAEAELAAGQAQIDSGQAQIDSTRPGLQSNKAQLEAGLQQAISSGAPQSQIDQLNGQLAQVTAGLAQLDVSEASLVSARVASATGLATITQNKDALTAAQAELDIARAELPAQTQQVAWGQALIDAAKNYRAVSVDNQTALGAVYFSTPMAEVSSEAKAAVVDALSQMNVPGVTVEFSKELATSLGSIVGPGELVGLVIAGVVLFVMLSTFVAAGLPVLTALLGVGISALGAFALSSVVEMDSTTPTLAVMLGLAVGIDYSLFVLNRHRRQLKAGMSMRDSIALANGTSGTAVLFAGLTVIIALLALNLTGIGFLGLMGTIGAIAIAIAVLAAVTFTPAIMKLSGMRVLSKRERARLATLTSSDSGAPTGSATVPVKREIWAAKRPVIALLITVGVLLVAAIPSASMRLGLSDGFSEPVESTQYRAYELTSDAFGAGQNGQVTAAIMFDRKLAGDDLLETQANIASTLMSVPNVEAVVTGSPSPDGKTLAFSVVPKEGPAAVSTEAVVNDLRAKAPQIAELTGGELGVTGMAAVNIDISKKLADALPLYLGTVIALSVLLMMLVFRSIAVPLVASAGFLLSVTAALGAVTAVYQWGWLGSIFGVHNPGPVMNFLPTILIGVLFGLAMDYQLFIAAGIREAYAHGDSARDAITHGVRAGRAVVIAAAIIMIAVFGSFAFAESTMIRPMGFGLAFGVLVDAFLVRLLLVPAALRLLGRGAWWLPKWLDRLLPDVDVEGSKLERGEKKESVVLVA
jgi:RND superfamily putative drug exporter